MLARKKSYQSKPLPLPRAMRRSLKRQAGGEVLEFAITAALVFALLFGIIEFSVGMFDQGTLVNAARVGAREASLFWVDPENIDPDNPELNQRVKTSEVADAIAAYTDDFLIAFFAEPSPEVQFQGQPIEDVADTFVVGPGDEVAVRLTLGYRPAVTAVLVDVLDLNLAAQAVMRVE
ncbi:MAG: TadE family protein [Pseudomonadota bacterium]|nr:TadE family protein [Pseudomonadota bacterium]